MFEAPKLRNSSGGSELSVSEQWFITHLNCPVSFLRDCGVPAVTGVTNEAVVGGQGDVGCVVVIVVVVVVMVVDVVAVRGCRITVVIKGGSGSSGDGISYSNCGSSSCGGEW